MNDHRPRVAAARRHKTRARLIDSALIVFGQNGVESQFIEDVIDVAGVSRGTFYNYFRTNDDVLTAVAEELGNDVLRVVDPIVQRHADPVARLACGVRSVLRIVGSHSRIAAFLSRAGHDVVGEKSLAFSVLARDIEAGVAAGKFLARDLPLSVDIVFGPVLAAIHRLVTRPWSADYGEGITYAILLGLGVSAAEAARAVRIPLEETALPVDSLLERARVFNEVRTRSYASHH